MLINVYRKVDEFQLTSYMQQQRFKPQMSHNYAIGFSLELFIPVKPLHNPDIVSVHFNHCYCTGNLRQTKQGLISVNLHISQHG